MIPEFHTYAEAELARQRSRYETRRKAFREAAAAAHTEWRLGRASQPANFSAAASLLGAGLGDISRLRLTAALLPVIHTLGRIEHDIDRIIALAGNSDPYAPRTPQPMQYGRASTYGVERILARPAPHTA